MENVEEIPFRIIREKVIKELKEKGVYTFKGKNIEQLFYHELDEVYEKTFKDDLNTREYLNKPSLINKEDKEEKRTSKKKEKIYVILNRQSRRVKIGLTNNPKREFNSLKLDLKVKNLVLFMDFKGTNNDLVELKKLIKDYSYKGKWYNFDKDLTTILKGFRDK